MNSIKFKISGYDEASHSLLISFASDTTASQDPGAYTAYAFQPLTMWPDVTDPQELRKRIASAGLHHAQMQEAKEKFVADPQRVAQLRQMVGKVYEFPVSELVQTTSTPFQTV